MRSQAQRPESGRSDYRKNDTSRSEREKRNDKPAKTEMRTNKDSRDMGKPAGDSYKTEKDVEISKDRDRPKVCIQSSLYTFTEHLCVFICCVDQDQVVSCVVHISSSIELCIFTQACFKENVSLLLRL